MRYSKYDGDISDALQAISESGFYRVVVANLFSVDSAIRFFRMSHLMKSSGSQGIFNKSTPNISEIMVESNIATCETAKKHSQLIPFIGLDPNAGLSPEAMASHLRVMAANHGARGVKLHPISQRFFPSDKRMYPTYRTCVDLGIPILCHCGLARTTQYAEPKAYSKVIEQFPQLKLILAHLGGGAWQQSYEFSRKYPNVCFDCSEIIEWTEAPGAPSKSELAELIVKIGVDRVMLGSDFPWYDLNRTAELVMQLPNLTEEQKTCILGANAIRFLKF